MLSKSFRRSSVPRARRKRATALENFVSSPAGGAASGSSSPTEFLRSVVFATEFPDLDMTKKKKNDPSSEEEEDLIVRSISTSIPDTWLRFSPLFIRHSILFAAAAAASSSTATRPATKDLWSLPMQTARVLLRRAGVVDNFVDLMPHPLRWVVPKHHHHQQQQLPPQPQVVELPERQQQQQQQQRKIDASNIEMFLMTAPAPSSWLVAMRREVLMGVRLSLRRVFIAILAHPSWTAAAPAPAAASSSSSSSSFSEAHTCLLQCLLVSAPEWKARGRNRFESPISHGFMRRARIVYEKAGRPELYCELVETAVVACFTKTAAVSFEEREQLEEFVFDNVYTPVLDCCFSFSQQKQEQEGEGQKRQGMQPQTMIEFINKIRRVSAVAMGLHHKQLPFLVTAPSKRGADSLDSGHRWHLSHRGLVVSLAMLSHHVASETRETATPAMHQQQLQKQQQQRVEDEADAATEWDRCIKCACDVAVFLGHDDDAESLQHLVETPAARDRARKRELVLAHDLQLRRKEGEGKEGKGHRSTSALEEEEEEEIESENSNSDNLELQLKDYSRSLTMTSRFIDIMDTVLALTRAVGDPALVRHSAQMVLRCFVAALETRLRVLSYAENFVPASLPLVVALSSVEKQIFAAECNNDSAASDAVVIPSARAMVLWALLNHHVDAAAGVILPIAAPAWVTVPAIVDAAVRCVPGAVGAPKPLKAISRVFNSLAALLADRAFGKMESSSQNSRNGGETSLHRLALTTLLGSAAVRNALAAAASSNEQAGALVFGILREAGAVTLLLSTDRGTGREEDAEQEGRRRVAAADEWASVEEPAGNDDDDIETAPVVAPSDKVLLSSAYRTVTEALHAATWRCGCGQTVHWPARACTNCISGTDASAMGDREVHESNNNSKSHDVVLSRCSNCLFEMRPTAGFAGDRSSSRQWCPCCTARVPAQHVVPNLLSSAAAAETAPAITRTKGATVVECNECIGQLVVSGAECPKCGEVAGNESGSGGDGAVEQAHAPCRRCGTVLPLSTTASASCSISDVICPGCGALRLQSSAALRSLQVRKRPEEALLLLSGCNTCAALNVVASTEQKQAQCTQCGAVQSFVREVAATGAESSLAPPPLLLIPYQQWICGCGARNAPTHYHCVSCGSGHKKQPQQDDEEESAADYTCDACHKPVRFADIEATMAANDAEAEEMGNDTVRDRCLVAPWMTRLGGQKKLLHQEKQAEQNTIIIIDAPPSPSLLFRRCPHCNSSHPVDALRLQRPAWALCAECSDGVVPIPASSSPASALCGKCSDRKRRRESLYPHRRSAAAAAAETAASRNSNDSGSGGDSFAGLDLGGEDEPSQQQQQHQHDEQPDQAFSSSSSSSSTSSRVAFPAVPWTCHSCGCGNDVHPIILGRGRGNNNNSATTNDMASSSSSSSSSSNVAPSGALLCRSCGADRLPVSLFSETEEWRCEHCGKRDCIGFACSICFRLHPHIGPTAVYSWVCGAGRCRTLNPGWLAQCRECGADAKKHQKRIISSSAAVAGKKTTKKNSGQKQQQRGEPVKLRYFPWHCTLQGVRWDTGSDYVSKDPSDAAKKNLNSGTDSSSSSSSSSLKPSVCILCGERHISLRCDPRHEQRRLDALEIQLMRVADSARGSSFLDIGVKKQHDPEEKTATLMAPASLFGSLGDEDSAVDTPGSYFV